MPRSEGRERNVRIVCVMQEDTCYTCCTSTVAAAVFIRTDTYVIPQVIVASHRTHKDADVLYDTI